MSQQKRIIFLSRFQLFAAFVAIIASLSPYKFASFIIQQNATKNRLCIPLIHHLHYHLAFFEHTMAMIIFITSVARSLSECFENAILDCLWFAIRYASCFLLANALPHNHTAYWWREKFITTHCNQFCISKSGPGAEKRYQRVFEI